MTRVAGFANPVHPSYVCGGGDLAFSCVRGGIAAAGLDFAHGFELYFDDATIVYNAGTYDKEWIADRSLTLIRSDGEKVTNPELSGGDEWCSAFTAELQAAVDGLNSGEINPMLSGTLARDALKLCYAEAKSISTGQIVEV